MKVVIACAKSKVCNAGYMKTEDGRCVKFVGDPDLAKAVSPMPGFCYAHPDGEAKGDKTWREKLVAYNKSCKDENPFGLLPAYKLYSHKRYTELVKVFGIDNVYILSAGWGLIRASFLTPNYDVTFSAPAGAYNLRGKFDQYGDFNHLESALDDDLLFLAVQKYLDLFTPLTQNYNGRRIVYHSTDNMTKNDLIKYVRYPRYFTNWQYKCAEKIMECYEADPCGFDPLLISWVKG